MLLAGAALLAGCSTSTSEPQSVRTDAQNVPVAIEIAFFDIADADARKVEAQRVAHVFAGHAALSGAFACAREEGELRCVSLDRGKSGRCAPLYEATYRPSGTLTLRKTYLAVNVIAEDATECFAGRMLFAELRDLLEAALVDEFGRERVRTHDLSRSELYFDRDAGKIRF
jgi:hypothetical protein